MMADNEDDSGLQNYSDVWITHSSVLFVTDKIVSRVSTTKCTYAVWTFMSDASLCHVVEAKVIAPHEPFASGTVSEQISDMNVRTKEIAAFGLFEKSPGNNDGTHPSLP